MDHVTLYSFPGSNACLSTELLLDHAGVDWSRRRVRPGPHAVGMRFRGFDGPTVPAIRIGPQRVQGTRRIAAAITDRHPDADLLPDDDDRRLRVLEAEHAGERFQNAVRRIVYVLAQNDPSVVRPLIDANYGELPGFARAGITRAMIAAASRFKRASRDRLDSDVRRIGALLDEFDALVAAGILGTDRPNVADFQIAPNLALLAAAPTLATALHPRPSWRIAERLMPRYPLTLDIDVPADWATLMTPDSD